MPSTLRCPVPSRQLDFPPSMNCQACGTALAATAKFCHKCGARVSAQVSAGQAAGWRAGLPWGVAGAALGALVTVLALRLGGSTGRGRGDAGGVGDGPLPSSPVPPPDISQMSPEECATRLYNRVMSLHSQGQADSAEFFLPMALQAYAMLPALDVDARYHIGVLDLTGGDETAALAQADSTNRAVPHHLFASMLTARALELRGDAAGARRAYGDFLRHATAQRARKRPEYADHQSNLDSFHEQATGAARKSVRGR